MRYIDLFAGIGGFRLGIEKARRTTNRGQNGESLFQPRGDKSNIDGGRKPKQSNKHPSRHEENLDRCVYTNEWDKYAAQIYEKNFKTKVDTRDITTVRTDEIPDHDLLCAGFPCQSFSIAGKRRGFDDTRGTLFFDIARILKDKRPRYFILENVKGLLSHDGGKTFQTILRVLTDLGYEYQWQVLNSKNFGVPQNRERVFIVGHTRETSRPEVFPIREIYKQTNRLQPTANKQSKGFQSHAEDKGLHLTRPETWRDAQRRSRVRRLTPTECERLQGFPDGWTEGVSDTQRYKTLGNAVTVNVVQAVIEKIMV